MAKSEELKQELMKEQKDLLSGKRPYESAAFVIFAVLMFNQLFWITNAFIKYFKDLHKSNVAEAATPGSGWNVYFTANSFNITAINNLQNFFNRILGIDSSKWYIIAIAFLALGLFYFLIYLLVWNYARKRGLPKWTWTLFILYGPTVFFMPPYMWFVLYVFKDYFFRFVKRIVEEYKAFDVNKKFSEEVEDAKTTEAVVEQPVTE